MSNRLFEESFIIMLRYCLSLEVGGGGGGG